MDSGKFSKCNSSCLTCNEEFTCDLCTNGFYKKDDENSNKCYQGNVQRYYLNTNSITAKYSKCDLSCSSCTALSTCIICSNGYFKKENENTNVCYNIIPDGFYLNDNKIYSKCDFSCSTCTALNTCISCSNGYFKKENENTNVCYKIIPDGYYLNDNKIYSKCDKSCSDCKSFSECSTCSNDYFKKVFIFFKITLIRMEKQIIFAIKLLL